MHLCQLRVLGPTTGKIIRSYSFYLLNVPELSARLDVLVILRKHHYYYIVYYMTIKTLKNIYF